MTTLTTPPIDAWTPKGSIQVQVSRDTFVYVSATRGFKSGGFNQFNPTAPESERAFNPEFAWSFEGGLKRTMAGGRVRVNTAVFSNDYRDLQVQSFLRPGVIDISNAGSATIRGIEVEAAAAAGRGVQLAGHFSWLDATYDRYLARGPGGATRDAAGNRLNNAPEWSGSGSAVYELATGRAGTASVRGDVSWQSRVFFTPVNDAIETQRAYGLLHLRAGFEPRSRRWEIAVYVRNAGEPGVHHRHGQRPAAGDHRPSRRAAPLGHAVHPSPLSRHDMRSSSRGIARNFHPRPSLVTTPAKPRDLHRTSSDQRRDSRSARKRAEEESWDMERRACQRSSHRCSFPGRSCGPRGRSQSRPTSQFPHQIVALTTSQNLLATDPNAIARFLETARPAPVSAEDKARVLSTLPLEGEVTDFNASARQKLAALTKLLRATGRESVYEIKVIAVPQAAIGLHARAVILISEAALTLLDADELQALVAHEVGHEYVWTERERSFRLADRSRLKDLELVCDGHRHRDAARAWNGCVPIDVGCSRKSSRFNRERFGTANNEKDYPTACPTPGVCAGDGRVRRQPLNRSHSTAESVRAVQSGALRCGAIVPHRAPVCRTASSSAIPIRSSHR